MAQRIEKQFQDTLRDLAMTIKRSTLRKFALSTFLFTLPLNAALAQDAAVADRLKAALAAQGVDISWAGVTGDNTSMVLQGVAIKPAAEKEALTIGDVKLENVTAANGGFTSAPSRPRPSNTARTASPSISAPSSSTT